MLLILSTVGFFFSFPSPYLQVIYARITELLWSGDLLSTKPGSSQKIRKGREVVVGTGVRQCYDSSLIYVGCCVAQAKSKDTQTHFLFCI